ncbi:MAG: family 43 glycosylhydrolase [Acidimicrobiales bacterium]
MVDPTITRADPAITWDPDYRVYRMYTSETWFANVPEWQSSKVTGPWRYVGDALPALPAWHGAPFSTWAPEVQDVDGVWTLWESTADPQGNFCLFRATARAAAGPFTVDPRRVPCDVDANGDIDPSIVMISGRWWLLDKTNGNAVDKPTIFYSQLIGPDGMPSGPRSTLLTSDQPWEMGMIEAPSFVQSPSTRHWWLVFSAGSIDLADPTYQIYATPCDGPEGPCHIAQVVKLVRPNAQGAAPGEEYAFDAVDGQAWIAYNPGGYFAAPVDRPLALVKLDFDDQGEPYAVAP